MLVNNETLPSCADTLIVPAMGPQEGCWFAELRKARIWMLSNSEWNFCFTVTLTEGYIRKLKTWGATDRIVKFIFMSWYLQKAECSTLPELFSPSLEVLPSPRLTSSGISIRWSQLTSDHPPNTFSSTLSCGSQIQTLEGRNRSPSVAAYWGQRLDFLESGSKAVLNPRCSLLTQWRNPWRNEDFLVIPKRGLASFAPLNHRVRQKSGTFPLLSISCHSQSQLPTTFTCNDISMSLWLWRQEKQPRHLGFLPLPLERSPWKKRCQGPEGPIFPPKHCKLSRSFTWHSCLGMCLLF